MCDTWLYSGYSGRFMLMKSFMLNICFSSGELELDRPWSARQVLPASMTEPQ